MLRVDLYNFNKYKNCFTAKPDNNQKSKFDSKTKFIFGTAATAIIGFSAYAVFRKLKATKTVNSLMTDFKKQMEQFPKDIEYRRKLAQIAGLKESEIYKLRPVIGMEEYSSIVNNFKKSPIHYTPGDTLLTAKKDKYPLLGKINKTFRATFHMHTTHSDGKMTVEELLNQATVYADEVAKVLEQKPHGLAKNAPFTIAITDHDTVEGCKEAVKIIASHPEKYKNLRVVLGCEFNVDNRLLGNELYRPVQNHIVVNALNPFDEELNTFLNSKKTVRKKVGKQAFNECLSEIKKLNLQFSESLGYESACKQNGCLDKGLLSVYYPVKSYFISQIKNSSLVQAEKDNLSNVVNNVMKKYQSKMTINETSTDLMDVIHLFEKQNGLITFAHPALTGIGECLNKPENSYDAMRNLFKLLKTNAKDKAFGVEIYYPYHGELAQNGNVSWRQLMQSAAEENGFYFLGGLDSHGKSIFYSNK